MDKGLPILLMDVWGHAASHGTVGVAVLTIVAALSFLYVLRFVSFIFQKRRPPVVFSKLPLLGGAVAFTVEVRVQEEKRKETPAPKKDR